MRDCKQFILLVCALGMTLGLWAQPKINDPYSILGLGNINDANFAHLDGMPGLTATFHHPFMMNVQNPAASSYLSLAAFEAGGNYQFNVMQSPNSTERVHTGNLSYFGLGFPLFNNLNKYDLIKQRPYALGMTFSLMPYTQLGYNLQQTSTLQNEMGDTITNVISNFQGTGGTYKLMWGNSIRYKGASLGVNLGYLFGSQNTETTDVFDALEFPFVNGRTTETNLRGFVWNVGMLYEYILPYEKEYDSKGRELPKTKTRLVLGMYGNSKNRVNTSTAELLERTQFFGGASLQDSISSSQSEVDGKVTLPAEFGIGLMLARDANWKVGFDYTYSGWGAYENDYDNQTMKDAFRIAVGGEWTPNSSAPFRQYAKRITYRAGGFYERDPRDLSTIGLPDDLTRRAVTFGVSMPLQPDRTVGNLVSFLNLSAEIGQYGPADFIRETYFKINIGFTLNDNRWFYRSKYN